MCLANPVLLRALARDRVAELHQSAGSSAHVRRDGPRPRVTERARRRAGWLLVDMGLRLAAPRA